MKNSIVLFLILAGYLFSGFQIDSPSQDYFIKLENTAEIELYLGENLSTWSSNKPLNQKLLGLEHLNILGVLTIEFLRLQVTK